MRNMPELESQHLRIRPIASGDLAAIHQLQRDIGWVDKDAIDKEQRESVRQYVAWSQLNHVQLARLGQPPYGDRAVVFRETEQLVGLCGLVPYVARLSVFPSFGAVQDGLARAEIGLMWAISPEHQRQGYATEVGQRLIRYLFSELRLQRVIATTGYNNVASQAVMRKVGMRLERNPFPEPASLQVLGILENDGHA